MDPQPITPPATKKRKVTEADKIMESIENDQQADSSVDGKVEENRRSICK